MTQMPQLSGRDVLRILGRSDFLVADTRERHAKLRRLTASGKRHPLTIPLHRNLDQETMHAIFRQAMQYFPEADVRLWFYAEDN